MATRRSRRLMFGVGIMAGLGVIVTLSLVWLRSSITETHADGAGPLASYNELGASGSDAVNPVYTKAGAWTFGMRLCVAYGSDLPVVDSVSPAHTVGSGFRFLGASVREFDPTPTNSPIISVDYYPPLHSVIPDALHKIRGYAVKTRCSLDPGTPYTELLVGMGLVNSGGGGWKGVDVHYTVGGTHRILAIDYAVGICGESMPCDPPQPYALAGPAANVPAQLSRRGAGSPFTEESSS